MSNKVFLTLVENNDFEVYIKVFNNEKSALAHMSTELWTWLNNEEEKDSGQPKLDELLKFRNLLYEDTELALDYWQENSPPGDNTYFSIEEHEVNE